MSTDAEDGIKRTTLPEGSVLVGRVTNYFYEKGVVVIQVNNDQEIRPGENIVFKAKGEPGYVILPATSIRQDVENDKRVSIYVGLPVSKGKKIFVLPKKSDFRNP